MAAQTRDTGSRMSPFDALLYRGDREPATRSMLVAACVLDRTPDRETFKLAIDRASRLVLRLRQRVVTPALSLALPVWNVDPDFDLDYHVRYATVEAPGTLANLLDQVQHEVVRPLDQYRPLWEMLLLEGLEDGRAAVLIKLSHAVSDGIGILKLFTALFDQQRRPPHGPLPAAPMPQDSTPEDALEQLLRRVPVSVARRVLGSSGSALSFARQILSEPAPPLRRAREYFASMQRVLAPDTEPSPALRDRSLARRCFAFDIPLARMKQASRQYDVSTNDVYLAGIVAALRRYHLELGVPPVRLPLAIPVNLRDEDDAAAGNRFGVIVLAAPLDVADPSQRLTMLKTQVRSGRGEPAIGAPADLAALFARLPEWLRTRVAARTPKPDVQASNIAGSPVPIYLAGGRVESLYAFGPLPGVAVMFAMQSLAGTCYVGVNTDAAAVTETELFAKCVHDGFAETLPRSGRAGPLAAPIVAASIGRRSRR